MRRYPARRASGHLLRERCLSALEPAVAGRPASLIRTGLTAIDPLLAAFAVQASEASEQTSKRCGRICGNRRCSVSSGSRSREIDSRCGVAGGAARPRDSTLSTSVGATRRLSVLRQGVVRVDEAGRCSQPG